MTARLRCVLAGSLLLALCGCQDYSQFYGRVFFINSTGGVIRSITIEADLRGELPEIAAGQAGIIDAENFSTFGDMRVSYVDAAGESKSWTIPFADLVPHGCRDDFAIEVFDHGPPRSTLMVIPSKHPRPSPIEIYAGLATIVVLWLWLSRLRAKLAVPSKAKGLELI